MRTRSDNLLRRRTDAEIAGWQLIFVGLHSLHVNRLGKWGVRSPASEGLGLPTKPGWALLVCRCNSIRPKSVSSKTIDPANRPIRRSDPCAAECSATFRDDRRGAREG